MVRASSDMEGLKPPQPMHIVDVACVCALLLVDVYEINLSFCLFFFVCFLEISFQSTHPPPNGFSDFPLNRENTSNFLSNFPFDTFLDKMENKI